VKKPTVKKVRQWSMTDIVAMCIRHNFYTNGDIYAYFEMLGYVDEHEPSPEAIYIVAENIMEYTDPDLDQSIPHIMYIIEREAVRTTLEIE